LLVCCGAAESFTETSVDLGQNVTLKCEVSVRDVFWFLMKPPEPPVFILRTYSSQSKSAEYSNKTFSKTFSLQYNSSLFIHNIGTNELGVYYCSQTALPYGISRGIRLYIQTRTTDTPYTERAVSFPENQTCDDKTCKDVKLWQNLFIILAIICLVLVVITGENVWRPLLVGLIDHAQGSHQITNVVDMKNKDLLDDEIATYIDERCLYFYYE
ncbi:uncharacterized protein DAT39_014208, partial [Clarias magur]